MKKLILGMLLLILPTNAMAQDCSRYEALSAIQKNRLEFAYHQGVEYDLGYTLSAISLTESNAGKWRVNPYSKDFGLFQVNIKTSVNVMGVTSHYKKLELAEKLIYNDILNAYIALDVLTYFKNYHKGDWKKMVMSYNNGFNIGTIKAKDYLDKVSIGVRMLQTCMKIY
jgi:hypothetical protein